MTGTTYNFGCAVEFLAPRAGGAHEARKILYRVREGGIWTVPGALRAWTVTGAGREFRITEEPIR